MQHCLQHALSAEASPPSRIPLAEFWPAFFKDSLASLFSSTLFLLLELLFFLRSFESVAVFWALLVFLDFCSFSHSETAKSFENLKKTWKITVFVDFRGVRHLLQQFCQVILKDFAFFQHFLVRFVDFIKVLAHGGVLQQQADLRKPVCSDIAAKIAGFSRKIRKMSFYLEEPFIVCAFLLTSGQFSARIATESSFITPSKLIGSKFWIIVRIISSSPKVFTPFSQITGSLSSSDMVKCKRNSEKSAVFKIFGFILWKIC